MDYQKDIKVMDLYSLHDEGLIPYLSSAIRQQQEEIETLKAEKETLRIEIDTIKDILARNNIS